MENLFRNIVYGSMALTLLTTPVAAQQKMNEMWGNGQQAKEINNMGERGHLFEWGNYAMVHPLGVILTIRKYLE